MNISMVGIDHSTAPVPIREKFSFTTKEAARLIETLSARADCDGCILLCTCNRTELWLNPREGSTLLPLAALAEAKGLDPADFSDYFFQKQDLEAADYLFELTSGLHSQILGEDQILTQVKDALHFSRELAACGTVLDVLFRNAITGAKKVKTELVISTASHSAVEYSIAQLLAAGRQLQGKRCLVIGNGDMGRRAATAFLNQGAEVCVTIRQYRSGQVEVIPGCSRINYSQRYDYIPQCDYIVSATRSPNMTLELEPLSACGIKPEAVLIDLAIPRDIDPAIGAIPGVELYDIDSFSIPETAALQQELKRARLLLEQQKTKFINWYECRDLLPSLAALDEYFGAELLARIQPKTRDMDLTPQQRQQLGQIIASTSGKLLNRLLFTVRDAAGIEAFRNCLDAAKELLHE